MIYGLKGVMCVVEWDVLRNVTGRWWVEFESRWRCVGMLVCGLRGVV